MIFFWYYLLGVQWRTNKHTNTQTRTAWIRWARSRRVYYKPEPPESEPRTEASDARRAWHARAAAVRTAGTRSGCGCMRAVCAGEDLLARGELLLRGFYTRHRWGRAGVFFSSSLLEAIFGEFSLSFVRKLLCMGDWELVCGWMYKMTNRDWGSENIVSL